MKRLVASRKLKRKCIYCSKEFKKGEVYYKKKEVYTEDCEIEIFEYLVCPRCNYYQEQHNKRFAIFKDKCVHPKKFISEIWSYIPGEAVKQPDHFECRLCGKWI